MLEAIPLIDRLMTCAKAWAEANDRSLSRLATIVVNDGKFFVRCEEGTANPTAATLERFARFLGEPANWPEGAVPDAVASFVHVVGVSPADGAATTGQADGMSGQVVA
ncbi:hypothetical protein B0I00_1873 [Novosphingobium kunmingense]|uniref:Uncharacterized protein n=2 Tax=Novosphingobium kunmingense TaxID=1211806 RepID=A0A2N0HKZ9_9SPHN|nr:hypothetical protein B0I00_1873 [Novosphingobium kunmingense]